MTKDLQATARQASSPTGVPTAFLEKGCTGKMPLAPRSRVTNNTVTNNLGRDQVLPYSEIQHHHGGSLPIPGTRQSPAEQTGQKGSGGARNGTVLRPTCVRNIRKGKTKQEINQFEDYK